MAKQATESQQIHPALLALAAELRDPNRRVPSHTGQDVFRLSDQAVQNFLQPLLPALAEIEADREKAAIAEQKERAQLEHNRWHGVTQ